MSGLNVPGLRHDEQNTLDKLMAVWLEKQERNLLRTTYFDTQNLLKDLKISLPPQLAKAEAMLGWPAKAVYSLGSRCSFDGFVVPGEDQDPFDLSGVLADNDMDIELPQAITSALVHAVSFLTVTKGDTEAGEPEVLVLARSAQHGAGLWDRRRRQLSAALAIVAVDDSGDPTELVIYLPESVVTCTKSEKGWAVSRQANPTKRVLVSPLVFRPELDRPFGHSRISRSVMGLTDAAIRTVVRSEVGAEFFSTPQRYLLGADEDAFAGNNRWDALVGRFLAIGKDEDADVPTVGQFPQMSMTPHGDQLRMFAGMFSGETGVPLSSLGIVHDNPASAEAIYAEKEDIVIEANAANRVFGSGVRNAAVSAVMLRDGLDSVPDELKKLQSKWRNPATPSVVSASDALVKQVAAIPWLAESDVALEALGYDQTTITRLLSDKRRVQGRQMVEGLSLAGAGTDSGVSPAIEDAQTLKAQADAMGTMIRAGVKPDVAAAKVGLGGMEFVPGRPITLNYDEV